MGIVAMPMRRLPYFCASLLIKFSNMKQSKKTLKVFVLSAAMAALLSLPLTMNAQYDEDKFGLQPWLRSGLLGKGESTDVVSSDGLMGRGSSGYSITNQTYGSDADGFGITNQTYGQDAPLGSGLLIMAVAGACYAGMKRNKKQTKK